MFEASVWFQAKWSPISREWLTSLLILSNLRALHAKKSHLHRNHLDNYATYIKSNAHNQYQHHGPGDRGERNQRGGSDAEPCAQHPERG